MSEMIDELRAKSVEEARDRSSYTSRELQILQCLANGGTNESIGRELFIERSTVKTHLDHIAKKMNHAHGTIGHRNRALMVATAFREGVVM